MLTLTSVAQPTAFIARRNPVAKLVCNAVICLTVLLATDWFTPLLVLSMLLIATPLSGVNVIRFMHRMRLMFPAAVMAAVLAAVFAAEKAGPVLIEIGPVLVTSGSAQTGAALGMRVVAVAACSILAFGTTDPTELADSLIQQWRVSQRFAIGSLAAMRLLPLLSAEWRLLAMARRARGIDAGWNPVARVRLFGSIMFALLVSAIRRGTRLATAMDARGFDAATKRTMARQLRLDGSDWILMAACTLICVATLTFSISQGQFRGLF